MADKFIKVQFKADVSDLTAGLNKADTEISGFGDRVGSWGKMAGAAFAAAGAAALAYAGILLKQGVESAIADAAAQEKLALTLKNVAGATDATVAATEDYITKTSLAFGVTDDQLRPSLERLARSTSDVKKAMDLQKIALDVSAGSGKSLESVTNALAKAYDGSTGALGKLGVGLSTTELKAMTFEQITQKLADTFEGQAAAKADTFAGKMERLKIAFDEGKETVGSYVLTALTPMMEVMVNKVIPAISEVSTKIGDTLGPKFREIGGYLSTIFKPILTGLKSAWDSITGAIMENKDAFQPLINALKTVAQFVIDTVAPALTGALGGALTFVGKVVGGIIDFIAPAIKAITTFIENAVNLAIKGINALISAYNKIPFAPDINTLKGVSFSTPTVTVPTIATPTVPTSSTTLGGGGGGGTAAGGAKTNPAEDKIWNAMQDVRIAQDAVTATLDKVNALAAQQLVIMAEADRASKAPTIIVQGSILDSEGLARAINDGLAESAARTGNYSTLGFSTNSLRAAEMI